MTRFQAQHLIASLVGDLTGKDENAIEAFGEDVGERVNRLAENLDEVLTHGIEFQDNVKGELLEATLDEGENVIQHGMLTTPYGYIVLYKEKEGDVFGSRVNEWNQEQLFLRSSVPNQKVRLFVL